MTRRNDLTVYSPFKTLFNRTVEELAANRHNVSAQWKESVCKKVFFAPKIMDAVHNVLHQKSWAQPTNGRWPKGKAKAKSKARARDFRGSKNKMQIKHN